MQIVTLEFDDTKDLSGISVEQLIDEAKSSILIGGKILIIGVVAPQPVPFHGHDASIGPPIT